MNKTIKLSLNQHAMKMVICLFALGSCFIGCNGSSGARGDAAAESKLPKMKFHRPKTAAIAAKRLREIHKSLVSESELPKPVQFSVVEVIHGEGQSAHSHYYLESKWDPDAEDHHHEGMKTTIEKHKLEVDAFTEMTDIVSWTPNIAAASELSEDDWNTVNKTCQSMEKLLESEWKNAKADSEKRAAYKKVATEFESHISQLESLVVKQDTKK